MTEGYGAVQQADGWRMVLRKWRIKRETWRGDSPDAVYSMN
jgi:hypothetical protein